MSFEAKKELLSLFDFIKSKMENDTEEIYDVREQIFSAQHSLIAHQAYYEKIAKQIEKLVLSGEPVPAQLHLVFVNAADKLRDDAKQYMDMVKRGLEIEVMNSSMMEGVQVLALLSQVPKMIATYLDEVMQNITDDLRNHVIECVPKHLHGEPWYENLLSHTFLGDNRQLETAKAVKNITGNLHRRIQELSVPGTNPSGEYSQRSVTVDELNQMIMTVPVSPSSATPEVIEQAS